MVYINSKIFFFNKYRARFGLVKVKTDRKNSLDFVSNRKMYQNNLVHAKVLCVYVIFSKFRGMLSSVFNSVLKALKQAQMYRRNLAIAL